MTREEFEQAKELDHKRLAMQKAERVIDRMKTYTKPNFHDLQPCIDALDLLPKDTRTILIDKIEDEVKDYRVYLENEIQKILEL